MICHRCGAEIGPGLKACGRCGFVFSTAGSRPLPPADAPGSCRYCGHPLGGKSVCEMCGSPAVPAQARTDAVKCPLCGGDLDDSLACRKCGSIVGGPSSQEETGVLCPKCSASLSLDDSSCGKCGLRIWLDGAAEEARLDSLRCPACGTAIGEGDAECVECGFLVWLETEEERRERAKSSIEEAESRMARVIVEHGDVPERAMTYIEAAKRIFEGGEDEVAMRRAMIAADIAETDARQRSMFMAAVKRAEERMRSAEDRGGDLSQCRELLRLSREADEKGDRKVAIRLALKCKILAENLEGSLSKTPFGA